MSANMTPTAARAELSAIALGKATEPDEQVLALAGLVIADELRMSNLIAARAFGVVGGELEPVLARQIVDYVRQATK